MELIKNLYDNLCNVLKSIPDSFCAFPPDVFAFSVISPEILSPLVPFAALRCRFSPIPPYVVAFPLYSWIVVSLYCRPFLSFATCPTSVQLSPSHLPCAVSTSFACRQSFTIHFLSHLHFPRLTCCIAMSPDFLPDESVIGIFVYSAVIQ